MDMSSEGVKHKILLILIVLTIIGEVLSIIVWTVNPSNFGGEANARFSLAADWVIAVANAVVMIPLNLIAFYGIFKRLKWSPLFLIIISILNRIASQFIFDGGMHGIFVTWTALLVIFAYNEYRGLSNFETSFLSGGVIFGLFVSAFLFNPVDIQTLLYGLTFYYLFLAFLVGTVIAIRKLR
jgi:hypothetical protein